MQNRGMTLNFFPSLVVYHIAEFLKLFEWFYRAFWQKLSNNMTNLERLKWIKATSSVEKGDCVWTLNSEL